jgi:MerR family transcriptional regulator, light-induced transcriptional regulator
MTRDTAITSNDTPMFTASEVESRTGVPATTLRQWERRYGLPNPQRANSGYRLYSQSDIGCIEFMRNQIGEGVPASRAAQLYVLAKNGNSPIIATNPRGAGEDLISRLIDATLAGDNGRADRVLSEAHASLSVEDVLLRVIQPTLVEIGEKWHRGEINVAHEHQASNFLRGKLHGLLELAGNSKHGPAIIVACAPDEWHEIGSLMLAIFLRRAGFRTHYLGANTPVEDLVRFAREVKAEALMISASNAEVIENLRPKARFLLEAAPLVIYGGAAFNERPEMARELGGEYLGSDSAMALDGLMARFDS